MTALMTPTQAARFLQVSRWTIYRWMESGRLMPLYHLSHPRIPREQLTQIQLGLR